MLPSYDDITDRLGCPLWWDHQGVPRYVPFHPQEGGVQARATALLEIQCQFCPELFIVAMEHNTLEALTPPHTPEVGDEWDAVGSFHYGDPPRHGCTGDSANSVPRKCLEFWTKGPPTWDWIQDEAKANLSLIRE